MSKLQHTMHSSVIEDFLKRLAAGLQNSYSGRSAKLLGLPICMEKNHNSFNDHVDLSYESGWYNMVMNMLSTMCNDTGKALTVLACVSSYLPHSLGLSSFTASPS